MADVDARIAQFKNMAEADPDNELGHFSLGKAYVDAGRFAEAEPALARTLQLKPTLSKAYQLLGQARLQLGKRGEAIQTLRQGFEVAAERGDIMPRDEIGKVLVELGETLPAVATKPVAATEVSAGGVAGFSCSRCGRPGKKMPERPFRGPLGEQILARICSECWQEWIPMGTKVINELGLSLADPQAQRVYDDHMKEFLQLND